MPLTDLENIHFPVILILFTYIVVIYVIRGYTNLIDYSFELMVYCFIADEEMFQGTQRFADQKLRAFFDQFGQESEKKFLKNVVRQERFKIEAKKKKKRKQGQVAEKKNKGSGKVVMFSDEEKEDDDSEEEDVNNMGD